MSGKEPHALGAGKAIRESHSGKALLVALDDEFDPFGKNVEIWIPKSVIHDDSEVYEEDDEGEILVHLWWAEKNGYAT